MRSCRCLWQYLSIFHDFRDDLANLELQENQDWRVSKETAEQEVAEDALEEKELMVSKVDVEKKENKVYQVYK